MAHTIRILIATDNHVGYAERDPIRGDDSWKTFHEIMCLAKEQDVDMVLLGGDLFHENKPSRKSMYNVMRSLRLNCYGDKPCEVEMLSDGTLHFDSTIGHANYEDPDINVAIPVFSIHGNHDDPSGEGLYAALDILEMAGLINYFGRVAESDNITINPLLFQKGNTKLALYGLSNVRDERLHRTFRDHNVHFKRPGKQTSDWFNVMCVHQNHHAYSATSYLPENQLPDYMDFIVWGHEHLCDTIAHKNPEKGFRVLQPGSTVATSLIAGEAAPKHAFILSVTGREFQLDPIRLRTVRPFVYKDIVLSQEKEAMKIAKKSSHRSELTRYLEKMVDGLITQARKEWEEAQGDIQNDEDETPPQCPLPIIRLRVETTPPAGSAIRFDLENPQRFSNRFTNRVANRNDVLQLHARKKTASTRATANTAVDADVLAEYETETIRVDKLVEDFLAAQSLSILPTNYFSEAVRDYIQKDNRHAMEMFVNDSLANQIKHLVTLHDDEEDSDVADDLAAQIENYRSQLEAMYAKGTMKKYGQAKFKPKPDMWDSEDDGNWEDQPEALINPYDDAEDDEANNDSVITAPRTTSTTRGRGRARGRGGRGATTTTGSATRGRGSKTTSTAARGRNKVVEEDEDEEQDNKDVAMMDDIDSEDDDNSQALFYAEQPLRRAAAATRSKASAASTSSSKAKSASTAKKPTAKSAALTRSKQSTLSFSQAQSNGTGTGRTTSIDIVDDDDDDDDFESIPAMRSRR